MSTRIHWAGEDGHRFCTHGRTATHREGSAAEFLRLPNLCRTCERAAQKFEALSVLHAFGAGKPKRIPAPQWPEPRPIAEAPKDGEYVLGYWSQQQYPRLRGLRWALVRFSSAVWATESGEPLTDPTHFLPMPPKPEVRK